MNIIQNIQSIIAVAALILLNIAAIAKGVKTIVKRIQDVKDATAEEMSAYYRAWGQMLRRRPDIYLQAFLSNISGGFYVRHETALSYTNFDNREAAPYPELCVPQTPRLQKAEAVARPLLRGVQHVPLVRLLFSVGFYPWVILFLFLDVLRKRQFSQILAQLPAILSVAVLLPAPVSGSYRYAMPMIYCIPFLLGTRLLPGREEEVSPLARYQARESVTAGSVSQLRFTRA